MKLNNTNYAIFKNLPFFFAGDFIFGKNSLFLEKEKVSLWFNSPVRR